MANYVKEMRELIGSRPFIMVGSTVLALNEEKHILFQLRTDTLKWGLPGGAMEIGESLEQTAARELFEETGLTTIDLKPIDVLSGQDFYFKYPNGDEVYNVIHVFLAEKTEGVPLLQDAEGKDLKYFSIHNLPTEIDERAVHILYKHQQLFRNSLHQS